MKYISVRAFFLLFILSIFALESNGQKLKVEEIVAKHLESLAKADVRTALKSFISVGDASAKFTSTKDQLVIGRIVLASEGTKNFFGLNMNSTSYAGERFSFDGKNVHVAFLQQGKRSILGNFIQSNTRIVEEGIFGGVLSSSWLLFNLNENGKKLSYSGMKKIGDNEAYVLGYAVKGGDIDVAMYFEKDTFRHLRTEYKRISSAGIGLRPEDSTRFSESRLKVTEDFVDFKVVNGLTLPHEYKLSYSITGGGGTTEIEWVFKLNEFAINQKLEANTFDAIP